MRVDHMGVDFSDTGCHSPLPLRESRPEIQVRKSAEGKTIRIYFEVEILNNLIARMPRVP